MVNGKGEHSFINLILLKKMIKTHLLELDYQKIVVNTMSVLADHMLEMILDQTLVIIEDMVL